MVATEVLHGVQPTIRLRVRTSEQVGQTPLHVLCLNPSRTSQAMELLVSALPESITMSDARLNRPLHYLCGNGACEPEMLRLLGTDEVFSAKNEVGSDEPSRCP